MISDVYIACMGFKSFLIGLGIHLILMQLNHAGSGLRNEPPLEALHVIRRLVRRHG
jgi:hypothetical protein